MLTDHIKMFSRVRSGIQGAVQQFDRMFRKLLGRGGSDARAHAGKQAAADDSQAAAAAAAADSSEAQAEALQVEAVGNEQLWLELISALTSALTRHLPSFWQLPQVSTQIPPLPNKE